MAEFDAAIKTAEAEIKAAQAKISEVSSKIDLARSKMEQGEDISIDIQNATLDDVHAHSNAMNANIAELIMGLDDVTAGFSKEFDAMREKSGWESFVGMFSSAKSDSMREERLRAASIDDKLQDLISKSDIIVNLLQSQLGVLNDHKTRVEKNLSGTLSDRESTVADLEKIRAQVLSDNKMSEQGLDSLPAEQKGSVEQEIARLIEQKLQEAMERSVQDAARRGQTQGVFLDIMA